MYIKKKNRIFFQWRKVLIKTKDIHNFRGYPRGPWGSKTENGAGSVCHSCPINYFSPCGFNSWSVPATPTKALFVPFSLFVFYSRGRVILWEAFSYYQCLGPRKCHRASESSDFRRTVEGMEQECSRTPLPGTPGCQAPFDCLRELPKASKTKGRSK